GPAYGENVGDAGWIVAQVFTVDGCLDEVERQQVAERRPHHRIVVGLTRLFGAAHDCVRKACSEFLVFSGPRPVVSSGSSIRLLRQQKRPSLLEILILWRSLVDSFAPT